MDERLIFGRLIDGEDLRGWLIETSLEIDADGLLPSTSQQVELAQRLFPPGVWLAYGAATPDAPMQARRYAVTLLPPGRDRASLSELLDLPMSLVEVARQTVRVISRQPCWEDPELRTLRLPQLTSEDDSQVSAFRRRAQSPSR